VFTTDPRTTIVTLPYLLDQEPHDQIMVVGMDAQGAIAHAMSFPTSTTRPLDDPLLESSLWGKEIPFVATVVYTDRPLLDIQPLIDAWAFQGRSTLQAAWAGNQRWRSYICETEGCCMARGNRYTSRSLGHDDFDPLPDRPQNAGQWRQERWGDWVQAIVDAQRGIEVGPTQLELLARTLHDIPMRDAVLAYSADPDGQARPGLDALLARMMARGTLGATIPVHTCAAALLYLDGAVEEAAHRVRQILETEEYSLARLLSNGLEMRAPASLLARSFAHYSPQQLLATDVRAA
jgi:hypothetical protein